MNQYSLLRSAFSIAAFPPPKCNYSTGHDIISAEWLFTVDVQPISLLLKRSLIVIDYVKNEF
ncbi:MAG: hypothetical protein F6K17_20795 [Okeania sp. SIO3C4]|nr:hypothetical protein [Okeania sp. SIO3B3]NER04862.1 hypothetical protein [Okeania sp. SIO3C4]